MVRTSANLLSSCASVSSRGHWEYNFLLRVGLMRTRDNLRPPSLTASLTRGGAVVDFVCPVSGGVGKGEMEESTEGIHGDGKINKIKWQASSQAQHFHTTASV